MMKDPNNAYGSKAARKKAIQDVQADIDMRDFADAAPISFRKRAGDIGPLTKMERMAKDDAYKNRVGPGRRLSEAEGDATRKRLIEKYAKEAPASKMPSSAESAASGNRMSKENAKDAKAVAKTTPRKRPSIGESMESAKRVGRQEGDEMRKMGMKHGGAVKKYAKGGVTRGDGIAKKGRTKGKIC
jgi:hypothetical protein